MQVSGSAGRAASNYMHPLGPDTEAAMARRWADFRAAAPEAGPESVPVMFGRTIELDAHQVCSSNVRASGSGTGKYFAQAGSVLGNAVHRHHIAGMLHQCSQLVSPLPSGDDKKVPWSHCSRLVH